MFSFATDDSDFRWQFWLLLMFIVAFLLAGCKSVSPANAVRQSDASVTNSASTQTNRAALAGTWHSIVVTPSPDLPKIRLCDELNPVWWLGNIDDPVPPASYKPDDRWRFLKWRFRNPFHNFDFYVIGIADEEFVRSGRYPEKVGNPRGGWGFAVSKYKCLRLPFVSYDRNRFHFYFGWRNHGNFGIKINLALAKKTQATPVAAHFTAPSEIRAPSASDP